MTRDTEGGREIETERERERYRERERKRDRSITETNCWNNVENVKMFRIKSWFVVKKLVPALFVGRKCSTILKPLAFVKTPHVRIVQYTTYTTH